MDQISGNSQEPQLQALNALIGIRSSSWQESFELACNECPWAIDHILKLAAHRIRLTQAFHVPVFLQRVFTQHRCPDPDQMELLREYSEGKEGCKWDKLIQIMIQKQDKEKDKEKEKEKEKEKGKANRKGVDNLFSELSNMIFLTSESCLEEQMSEKIEQILDREDQSKRGDVIEKLGQLALQGIRTRKAVVHRFVLKLLGCIVNSLRASERLAHLWMLSQIRHLLCKGIQEIDREGQQIDRRISQVVMDMDPHITGLKARNDYEGFKSILLTNMGSKHDPKSIVKDRNSKNSLHLKFMSNEIPKTQYIEQVIALLDSEIICNSYPTPAAFQHTFDTLVDLLSSTQFCNPSQNVPDCPTPHPFPECSYPEYESQIGQEIPSSCEQSQQTECPQIMSLLNRHKSVMGQASKEILSNLMKSDYFYVNRAEASLRVLTTHPLINKQLFHFFKNVLGMSEQPQGEGNVSQLMLGTSLGISLEAQRVMWIFRNCLSTHYSLMQIAAYVLRVGGNGNEQRQVAINLIEMFKKGEDNGKYSWPTLLYTNVIAEVLVPLAAKFNCPQGLHTLQLMHGQDRSHFDRMSMQFACSYAAHSEADSQSCMGTSPLVEEFVLQKSAIVAKLNRLMTAYGKEGNYKRLRLEGTEQSPFLAFLDPQMTFKQHGKQYDGLPVIFKQINPHNPLLQASWHSTFYRNHGCQFLYLEVIKLLVEDLEIKNDLSHPFYLSLVDSALKTVSQLHRQFRSGPILVHNTVRFYQILALWKFVYAVTTPQVCLRMLKFTDNNIFNALIDVFQEGNLHPLMRQYSSAVLCRLYTQILQEEKQPLRDKILGMIGPSQQIDLNTAIPVILTLGHEMLRIQNWAINGAEEGIKGEDKAIMECIFGQLVRIISCHQAYVRSICQYYVMKYLERENQSQSCSKKGFLEHLALRVWKQDKDCLKIMRNVGIVVDGFKDAVEANPSLSFLVFERVEESPSEPVRHRLNQDLYTLLAACQIQAPFIDRKLHQLGQKLWQPLNEDPTVTVTINKDTISKGAIKKETRRQQLRNEIDEAEVIIIGSLLEKVHNFGHILRTVYQFQGKVMFVVPSKMPLEHPECQELIPSNSKTVVIEIKETELQDFINLQKGLGYPLIALEQCAGSVKLQDFSFPARYMLLLGNERKGAPSWLLNQADTLVEIPQVGKVRSHNVHVSMAICVWQSLMDPK